MPLLLSRLLTRRIFLTSLQGALAVAMAPDATLEQIPFASDPDPVSWSPAKVVNTESKRAGLALAVGLGTGVIKLAIPGAEPVRAARQCAGVVPASEADAEGS